MKLCPLEYHDGCVQEDVEEGSESDTAESCDAEAMKAKDVKISELQVGTVCI